MRAGDVQRKPAISEAERASLRAAQADDPELGNLRAGHVGTILAVVLIVLLVLILV